MTQLTQAIQIIQGDALSILPSLPDGSVDAVITDMPSPSLNQWREIGTTTRLGGHRDAEKRAGWFETITNEDIHTLICEFSRLLKRNAHAWLMCDGDTLHFVLGYAREGDGHRFCYSKPYPVLKRAATGGYKPGMGYHGRACHEYVVLLEQGRRRFTEENWPDVFEAVWSGDAETKPYTPDGKPYPTAKPLALFQRWLTLSTREGETVLDPFGGSGTVAVAAALTGRKAITIDTSPYALTTTRARLAALSTLRGDPVPGDCATDSDLRLEFA